jgi:glycosyltransferase involved in cell wall biosynthesis
MTQQPLVSLIVPTLCRDHQANRIVSLRKLLEHYLPEQVYSNFEVIVISDGPNAAVERLVDEVEDPRMRYRSTAETSGFGGLPETRLGFEICKGEYCLRMNDDNEPYPNYLAALLSGFQPEIDFVYARVIFSDEARGFWRSHFAGMTSYILPNDKAGTIHANNVDWMNFMFRTTVARRHGESMCRSMYGDWEFITELLAHDVPGRFIDRLVGHKC